MGWDFDKMDLIVYGVLFKLEILWELVDVGFNWIVFGVFMVDVDKVLLVFDKNYKVMFEIVV